MLNLSALLIESMDNQQNLLLLGDDKEDDELLS